MNKKRIGIVIQKYSQIGGSENFAYSLTEKLSHFEEFDIHVFANEWEKSSSPITFHHVPIMKFPRWLKPVSFAYFANQAIKKMNCDIIHSHERLFNMDILTYHGIPHITWAKRIKQSYLSLFDRATIWIEKKSFSNNSLLVLPVSNLVKDELLHVYHIPENRIKTLHPGIEIDKFSSSDPQESRKKIRNMHDISDDDIVILFVGMNFEIKRLDFVLEAMAHLSRKQAIKLLIAGKGNINKYQKIASRFGISENVIFAGTVRNIHEYYFASDIFVLPSQFDTFGLVVLEAMISGLPVIITSTVGAKDLIQSEINGIVLPDNSTSNHLADAFKRLMNYDYRQSLAQKGMNTAKMYSWDHYVNQLINIYDTLSVKRII